MLLSNDSFDASETDEGLLIEEKKKGALKMLLVIIGIAILMVIISLFLAIVAAGSTIVMFIAPVLFWGGILVTIVSIIAVIIKTIQNSDPRILFNTDKSILFIRGKEIPFSDITDVIFQSQEMLGKTATFIFLKVDGKKKTIFSTSVVTKDIDGMKGLNERIKDIVNVN